MVLEFKFLLLLSGIAFVLDPGLNSALDTSINSKGSFLFFAALSNTTWYCNWLGSEVSQFRTVK